MYELKNCYTLDEALKLYALYDMAQDMRTGASSRARLVVLQTGVNGRADLYGQPEQRGVSPF